MSQISEAKTYIATRPSCGHVVFAVVNIPDRAKSVAKEIAACIRQGFEISLVDTEWVRNSSHWCCCPKEKREEGK